MAQPVVGVITSRHTSLTLKDVTPTTPISRTLGPGPGTWSFGDLEEGNKESIPIYSHGIYVEDVYGQDKEVTVSGEIHMLGDQTGESITDAILKSGDFAAGITDNAGEVWTLICTITIVRSSTTNTFVFNKCRVSGSVSIDPGGSKVSVTIKCRGGYTRT